MQTTCPNKRCNSDNVRAFGCLFGEDPTTLSKGVYIMLQCDGCGEIFQRLLK